MAALAPLTIKEVSLMLRSGYSSEVVIQELAKRKFADTLDSTSEKQLVAAGASQSLISTLQSGVYQLSAAEIATAKQNQMSEVRRSTVDGSTSNAPTSTAVTPISANARPDEQIGGTMYDHLKDDLVYWHEGSLIAFDDEALQKKRFYLLFFSAVWSKEGRQLTTRLVDYYNRVQPQHPEFEVVFCSADRSAFAMEIYISQARMPWPAVAYDKRGGKAGATQQGLIRQIPHLILADASGKILSDSGDNPPDFDKVLGELDKILTGR